MSSGTAWSDELTDWGREARFLREYYNFPLDGYSFNVQNVFALLRPIQIWLASGPGNRTFDLAKRKGSVFLLPPSAVESLTDSVGVEVGARGALLGQCSVSAVCLRWSVCPDAAASALACMLIAPVSKLLLAGQWSELLWLGRWTHRRRGTQWHLCESYPDDAWVATVIGQHEQPIVQSPLFDADAFHQLAGHLRRWAPAILHAVAGFKASQRLLFKGAPRVRFRIRVSPRRSRLVHTACIRALKCGGLLQFHVCNNGPP